MSRQHKNDVAREWRRKNPEKVKLNKLRYHLKKTYGVDLAWFNNAQVEQGGKCAICGEAPRRALQIDHNHTTGTARALLCPRCNLMLGSVKESQGLLLKAVLYLRRFDTLASPPLSAPPTSTSESTPAPQDPPTLREITDRLLIEALSRFDIENREVPPPAPTARQVEISTKAA